MSSTERLWLNGFTTASEVLADDRLAIEEVRQALEDDLVSNDPGWRPGRPASTPASAPASGAERRFRERVVGGSLLETVRKASASMG